MPIKKMAQRYAEACERVTTRDVLGMLLQTFVGLEETGLLDYQRAQDALAEAFETELSAIRVQLALAPTPPLMMGGAAYCLTSPDGLAMLRLRAHLSVGNLAPEWTPVLRNEQWRARVSAYCKAMGCEELLDALDE